MNSRNFHGKHSATWAGLGLTALTLGLAPQAARAADPAIVATDPVNLIGGQDNPYQMTFGPDGGLYVAEAGTGGTGAGFVNGAGNPVTFGDTGSIVEYLPDGTRKTVISGLPSLIDSTGEATGLQGLTYSDGTLYGAFGFGGTPANQTTLVSEDGGNSGLLGQLVSFNLSSGVVTPLSNLTPYDSQTTYDANNPDGLHQTTESNPYNVAVLPDGTFAVTDGGGNVVLSVPKGGGAPSLLTTVPAQKATQPPIPYQSVPTGITALGSDLYFGEFTGYPFPAGGANLYKFDPTGGLSVLATGFTTTTAVALGPDGDIYVLDDTTGNYLGSPSPAEVYRVDPTTGDKTVVATLGPVPGETYTGLAVGRIPGTFPGTGPVPAIAPGIVPLYVAVQGQVPPPAVPEAPAGALLALGLLPIGLAVRKRLS